MTTDRPDFSQAVVPSMPSAGEGQVPWYMSKAHLVTGGEAYDLVNYVVPDNMELHVCSGVVSCGMPRLQRYDLRQTPAATWISPASHADPDNEWEVEERAYDEDIDTYAWGYISPYSWGNYLILVVNEASIDKVRFYVWNPYPQINQIDIDVYYDGAWHDVYEGEYTGDEWEVKDIPTGAKEVSKARVRFYNAAGKTTKGWLSEFQFNTSGTTPQEGIWFDTHAIIPYLPEAPYLVEAGATFTARVYNDDPGAQNMSVSLAGFLQKKV